MQDCAVFASSISMSQCHTEDDVGNSWTPNILHMDACNFLTTRLKKNENIASSTSNRVNKVRDAKILVCCVLIHAIPLLVLRPPGLMDKALPSGGKDSEFESWGGRF